MTRIQRDWLLPMPGLQTDLLNSHDVHLCHPITDVVRDWSTVRTANRALGDELCMAVNASLGMFCHFPERFSHPGRTDDQSDTPAEGTTITSSVTDDSP
jgi:hypothetical protein